MASGGSVVFHFHRLQKKPIKFCSSDEAFVVVVYIVNKL